MADEEQQPTKRERQKQRKQAKREAEQTARRQQRVRKTLASGLVVVLLVAALGAAGFVWQQSRAERGELLAGEAASAQEAGCLAVEEPTDLGADHFTGDPQELEAEPPWELYDHQPTTSGKHLGLVAATGVYDRYVDERLLVHNLEHGYVIAWWDPELPDDEVAEITAWAEGTMGDANDHLIAAPYYEPLPDGGQVALVAWGHRQLCDTFSPEVADAFVSAHAENLYTDHPPTDAHDGSGQGELVPGRDAVVFPPHDDAEATAPGMPLDHGDGDDED